MKRWVQFIFLLLAAVTAFGSNGLVSPFAPEAAYNAYGGSIERLEQRLPLFYGGQDQSLTYQVTYGTLSAATVFIGSEFGQAGRLGRAGVWTAEPRLAGMGVSAGKLKSVDNLADLGPAARRAALRNPNVYEVLYEAPISGTTRAAHRAAANDFLADQLRNDAQLNSMFNQLLGRDVLQHMESGRSGLLNPPGTVWHHPVDNPNVMQLLIRSEHTTPSLGPILHPGGVGGFGNFYGP